jgi:hypothetical protein
MKRFSGSWRWLWLLLLMLAPMLWLRREAAAEPLAPAAIQAWDEAILFSTTSAANGAYLPVIGAAANGTLLGTYNHRIGTLNNPYYRLRPPGTLAFSNPAPLHVAANHSTQLTFAFDNNSTAHAVWRTDQNEVLYAHQIQWASNDYEIVTSAGSQQIRDPYIDVGGNGHIHVVWTQGENPQSVYYSYSTNSGNSWSAPQMLSADDGRNAIVPKVVVDASNKVHVVWEARVFDIGLLDFRWQIDYRTATWNGASYVWSALPAAILSTGIQDVRPALLAIGNELHLTYTEQVEPAEGSPLQYVYYRHYIPGTGWLPPVDATGGPPVTVNTNSPFYLVTTITNCDEDIYVYFHGALSEGGQEQILGSNSTQNWAVRDFVTDGQTRDVNPSVTCDDGQLHILFERIFVANQNHQVYYITGAPEGLFLPFISRK